MKFPNWQLHRGFWQRGVRENTMEAFKQAKLMDCEMVEMDVQVSRDNVLHVFHDFTLKRFFHINQKIGQTKSEDLTGLNIPRLQEVLESDEVPYYLNIEIKSKSFLSLKVCRAFADLMKKSQPNKKVMVSSFNPFVLFWCRYLIPETPRALLVGNEKTLRSQRFEWALKLTAPDYINCHYSLIDDEDSRELLVYFAKPLMVWTVNDPVKAEEYLTHGAKSIISDLPPRFK